MSFKSDFIIDGNTITGYKIKLNFRSDCLYHDYTSSTEYIETYTLSFNYNIGDNSINGVTRT